VIYALLAHRSPRFEDWTKVFGANKVPLLSPEPVRADSPVGRRVFYRVDVRALNSEQFARLTDHLSAAFGLDRELVRSELAGRHGLPILADDIAVVIDARFFG